MKTIIVVIAIMLIYSCNRKPKNQNPPLAPTEVSPAEVVTTEIPKANNSLHYLGIYKGKLPCADCSRIETSLELSEDFTYTLLRKYVGKSDKAIELKGTFSWNKDETAIILDNLKDEPNHYLVGENMLTLLDMNGNPIQGKLASNYILRKMTEAEGAKTDALPANVEIQNNK